MVPEGIAELTERVEQGEAKNAELKAQVEQLETENAELRKQHEALTRRVALIGKRTDAIDVHTDPAAMVRLMSGKYQGVGPE